MYYNPTSNEIQSRSTAGSFLCLSNNVNQSTSYTVLFPNTLRSVGNVGLTYSAGVFTNSTGQTLILNVSANWSFINNTTGNRAGWITHSGLTGYIGFVDLPASNTTEPSGVSVNTTLCLLNGENFYLTTWRNSGSSLDILYGYIPFLSITLLN